MEPQSIAEESKRLAITNLLASAFRVILATTPSDLLPVLYLCTNRVAPAHEGIELGIGDAILMKVRTQCSSQTFWKHQGIVIGILNSILNPLCPEFL